MPDNISDDTLFSMFHKENETKNLEALKGTKYYKTWSKIVENANNKEQYDNWFEKYHNSKIKSRFMKQEDMTIHVVFENGEETWFGFITLEEISNKVNSYSKFERFYKKYLKTIKKEKI